MQNLCEINMVNCNKVIVNESFYIFRYNFLNQVTK